MAELELSFFPYQLLSTVVFKKDFIVFNKLLIH